MKVYRIAKTKYLRDLTGSGSRLYGGRWNFKGTGLIYTSETRALATVELLVHLHLSMVPQNLSIGTIEIPDHIIPEHISTADLPPGWRNYPAPLQCAEIGTRRALSNESLLLRVPSAVVEHEFNILINPSHPDIRYVSISHIEDYKFDDRLLHSTS